MINRRIFLRGALGGAALALGAPAIAQDRPLRLGLLAPRSGVGAFLGEDSIRAVRWGADRINRSGGIAGRRVELVVERGEIIYSGSLENALASPDVMSVIAGAVEL